jgi:hypothetical protein
MKRGVRSQKLEVRSCWLEALFVFWRFKNLALRRRTPRSAFVVNEVCVDVWHTNPPNSSRLKIRKHCSLEYSKDFQPGRVQVSPLTLTSLIASKARGVLHLERELCP